MGIKVEAKTLQEHLGDFYSVMKRVMDRRKLCDIADL